jgi:hypothetical protein
VLAVGLQNEGGAALRDEGSGQAVRAGACWPAVESSRLAGLPVGDTCRSLAYLPLSSGRRAEFQEAALVAALRRLALSSRARVVECTRTRPVASITSARASYSSTKALGVLAEQPAQARPLGKALGFGLSFMSSTVTSNMMSGHMSVVFVAAGSCSLSVSSPATSLSLVSSRVHVVARDCRCHEEVKQDG